MLLFCSSLESKRRNGQSRRVKFSDGFS
jgi:hypothetical protein